jgi:hypothetical protein
MYFQPHHLKAGHLSLSRRFVFLSMVSYASSAQGPCGYIHFELAALVDLEFAFVGVDPPRNTSCHHPRRRDSAGPYSQLTLHPRENFMYTLIVTIVGVTAISTEARKLS